MIEIMIELASDNFFFMMHMNPQFNHKDHKAHKGRTKKTQFGLEFDNSFILFHDNYGI